MEENQDINKGFWVNDLFVPDETGYCAGHSLTGYKGKVKVTLGKPKKDGSKFVMHFKIVMPDYVIDKLQGKEIERSRGGMNAEVRKYTYEWMKTSKTINAISLDALIQQYDRIIGDFMFILSDEKKPREKVIFVDFQCNFNTDVKSSGNSAKMGKNMSLKYNYFVGYFNGNTYYDCDLAAFNTYYDKEIIKYTRIPWTQEREDFFEKIYENFISLKDKLNEFFKLVTPENIDSAINNFKLLV